MLRTILFTFFFTLYTQEYSGCNATFLDRDSDSDAVTHSEMWKYLAYGNELKVAGFYLDRNPVDEHAYLAKFSSCEYFDTNCINRISEAYVLSSTLWQPKKDDSPKTLYRRYTDCEYGIKLVSFDVEYERRQQHQRPDNARWLIFKFQVNETNCTIGDKSPSLLLKFPAGGGSSFDVLSHNNKTLVTCTTNDHMNNLYDLVCRLPDLKQKTSLVSRTDDNMEPVSGTTVTKHCVQLTIVLEYEHYDAYSFVLNSASWDDFSYPVLRHTIADNQLFCAEAIVTPPPPSSTAPSNGGSGAATAGVAGTTPVQATANSVGDVEHPILTRRRNLRLQDASYNKDRGRTGLRAT